MTGFALGSKPGLRPEPLDSPRISARQEIFQKKKDIVQRFCVACPVSPKAGLVSFTAFLNSSTKRRAASFSGEGAGLLGSFGLVFESFGKAEHSKEQSHPRCYVDG